MSDISNILPSYLDKAGKKEKEVFFKVLIHLSAADGHSDESEIEFIREAAETQGIANIDELFKPMKEDVLIDEVKIIKNRHLALELIKEMCMLSHVDNLLSDEETLFIGKVGIALGVEIEKIEQISNWIIDRIIWMEQAKYIFEEK